MKRINLIVLIAILVMVGCEDSNSENISVLPATEIITTNVNSGPYYFNLVSSKQTLDSPNASWHILYHNIDAGDGYLMPNININNTVLLSINSISEFEAIQSSPAISLFSPGGDRMQYGGPSAVLSYDMAVHKVGVSNDTYVLYDTISNKVFKVRFDDYSNGVVVFRYAELSEN